MQFHFQSSSSSSVPYERLTLFLDFPVALVNLVKLVLVCVLDDRLSRTLLNYDPWFESFEAMNGLSLIISISTSYKTISSCVSFAVWVELPRSLRFNSFVITSFTNWSISLSLRATFNSCASYVRLKNSSTSSWTESYISMTMETTIFKTRRTTMTQKLTKKSRGQSLPSTSAYILQVTHQLLTTIIWNIVIIPAPKSLKLRR